MSFHIKWDQGLVRKFGSTNHFRLLNQLRNEVKAYPLKRKIDTSKSNIQTNAYNQESRNTNKIIDKPSAKTDNLNTTQRVGINIENNSSNSDSQNTTNTTNNLNDNKIFNNTSDLSFNKINYKKDIFHNNSKRELTNPKDNIIEQNIKSESTDIIKKNNNTINSDSESIQSNQNNLSFKDRLSQIDMR